MRPRFLIFISIVILATFAVLFWWRLVQSRVNVEQRQMIVQFTNEAAAADVSVANQGTTGVAPSTTSSPTVPRPSAANKIGTLIMRFVEGNNVPIELYGQVIDQDSNRLAGVDVKFRVQQLTAPSPASMELGAKEVPFERITGPDGRFEIKGVKGESLDLESIHKDGYEVEPTKRGFGPSEGSLENPVIFKMWDTNIHEQLITGQQKFQIVPDGRSYVIDLAKGTIAESGQGDLKVWIQYTNQVVRGQPYDWSATIEVMNGGLFEQHLGSAMYEAPADGYVPSFQLQQQIKGGQSGEIGERLFYLQLKNGQEYGQMSIDLYAPFNEQVPGLIRLSYAINPSGSRILR
jgi:hypothetical protein